MKLLILGIISMSLLSSCGSSVEKTSVNSPVGQKIEDTSLTAQPAVQMGDTTTSATISGGTPHTDK